MGPKYRPLPLLLYALRQGPQVPSLHDPTKQRFGSPEHSQLSMTVLRKVEEGPAMACIGKGPRGEHE